MVSFLLLFITVKYEDIVDIEEDQDSSVCEDARFFISFIQAGRLEG